MPQRVWGNRLLDAGELAGLGARQPNGRSSNRSAGKVAWKEPRFGVRGLPIDPQDLQQSGREHDIAILLIFALHDPDHHALAVDIAHFQVYGFRNAQPCRVGGHQDGAVLATADAFEETGNLFAAQDHRQLERFLGNRNIVERPFALEGHVIEEAQRGRDGAQAAGGKPPLMGQIQLVGLDLGGAEYFG